MKNEKLTLKDVLTGQSGTWALLNLLTNVAMLRATIKLNGWLLDLTNLPRCFLPQVQPHDVIGMYFPNRNPIPFDSRRCDGNAGFYRRYPGNVRSGRVFDFDKITDYRWFPCREYSIQAVVETGL